MCENKSSQRDCGWLHIQQELDSSCINSSATMIREGTVFIELWLQYARLHPLSHRSTIPTPITSLIDTPYPSSEAEGGVEQLTDTRLVSLHHIIRYNHKKVGNTFGSYTPTAATQYYLD